MEFDEYGEKKFDDFHEYIYEINDITVQILDTVKKSIFYRKPFDIQWLQIKLKAIFQLSWHLSLLLDGDLKKLCEINIEKLQHRYPEKFTTQKAIDRDLDRERKILEK